MSCALNEDKSCKEVGTTTGRSSSAALDVSTTQLRLCAHVSDHMDEMQNESSGRQEHVSADAKSQCSVSSLPPLDHVTACSDDSDSVSTLSSDEDGAQQQQQPVQRSIFKSYWQKNGLEGTLRTTRTCWSESSSHVYSPNNDDANIHGKCYTDRAPPRQQQSHEYQQEVPRRRPIFDRRCWPMSSPSLTSVLQEAFHETPVRKTRSTSALGRQPAPMYSCLRRARFSGQQGRRISSASSDASVRFSSDVDIRYFKKPVENWADDEAWAQWFA